MEARLLQTQSVALFSANEILKVCSMYANLRLYRNQIIHNISALTE